MKNFVRVLALSLVATGAFAATQIHSSSDVLKAGKTSLMPMAGCPLGSGSCMGNGN